MPKSLWESYSAFANSDGGVILLGADEAEDGSFVASGVGNVEKVKKDFWNTINNRSTVSINLLGDADLVTHQINDAMIIAVHVPCANREFKPVYINDDLFNGTFRRNGEGDYHCSKNKVRAMLRDLVE